MFNVKWLIWLILNVIWNFGWPKASPIYDVTIAILLSVFIYLLNKYKKFG